MAHLLLQRLTDGSVYVVTLLFGKGMERLVNVGGGSH